MMQIKKAVVLANGAFPKSKRTKEILTNADFLVCCDGAANELIGHQIIPHIIIGDGDSICPELKVKYETLMIICSDQETNDLTKAIEYVVSKGCYDITILGGTGKREDHTIGNIALLMEYMPKCNVKMVTETGTFIPCHQTFNYHGKAGQQLSIFNFGCSILTGLGLLYPIRPFKKWWEGTLNEINRDEVTITADSDFLVFITHDVK